MTFDAWTTLIVLAVSLAMLSRDRVAPSVILFGADVFLMLVGVVDAREALSGFSNPAPFTVAALYVLARSIEKTGGLQPLIRKTLEGKGGQRSLMTRLLVPVAAASAFLNNTPIVAMLTPEIADHVERKGEAASRYLMPLSFAAILGGTVTVIGTSTTVVVSGLLEAAGQAPLSMFEITPVALPIAAIGVVYLILLGPKLVPDRRASRRQFSDDVREFTVNMRVQPDGPLVNQSVEGAGLRRLQGMFLAEIHRRTELIAPVAPEIILQPGDLLTFVGQASQVLDLESKAGLVSAELEHAEGLHGAGHTYFEVVIGPGSNLVGRTLRQVDFRSQYQAAVLAIHRAGERLQTKLGEAQLQPGDTLRLIADAGFRERWHGRPDFLLVAGIGGLAPTRSREAGWVVAILAGVVGLTAMGVLPILHASLLGAILIPALGIMTPAECRRAVDLDVIVMIAAAFGLGASIQSSGLADLAAGAIFAVSSGLGPAWVLLGLVVATLFLTEVITNNAAAVLMFPVAVSAASTLGIDARPFALGLAIAASASFLTPIGYQTNTMVYGPGGYRFSDYARLGIPLTILVAIMISVLVPKLWL